jgi:serine/threonine protein kinase
MNTSDARDLFSDSPDDGWRPLSVQALAEDLRSTHPQITVLRFHAKGGMGAIYEGRLQDEKGGTIPVAIKVLRPDAAHDADYLRRFRREQDILASLGDHPNIVRHRLHGATSEGYPFLVMDWVQGAPLTTLTERNSSTDRPLLLKIADDLCAAVQHAHEHQILHRDLKPQNVIVTPQNRAVVLDFGIARSLRPGNTVTQPGDSPGTFGYIAPEVRNGEKPDERADIYSLGIIIYQLLMKEVPDVFAARPSERCLDHRFDEIVMKAANPDRHARYSTSKELRAALVSVQQSGKLGTQSTNNDTSYPRGPDPRIVVIEYDDDWVTINGRWFAAEPLLTELVEIFGEPDFVAIEPERSVGLGPGRQQTFFWLSYGLMARTSLYLDLAKRDGPLAPRQLRISNLGLIVAPIRISTMLAKGWAGFKFLPFDIYSRLGSLESPVGGLIDNLLNSDFHFAGQFIVDGNRFADGMTCGEFVQIKRGTPTIIDRGYAHYRNDSGLGLNVDAEANSSSLPIVSIRLIFEPRHDSSFTQKPKSKTSPNAKILNNLELHASEKVVNAFAADSDLGMSFAALITTQRLIIQTSLEERKEWRLLSAPKIEWIKSVPIDSDPTCAMSKSRIQISSYWANLTSPDSKFSERVLNAVELIFALIVHLYGGERTETARVIEVTSTDQEPLYFHLPLETGSDTFRVFGIDPSLIKCLRHRLECCVARWGPTLPVKRIEPVKRPEATHVERFGSTPSMFDELIACPKCQKLIADDALTCPHCGSVNTQGRMEAERVETIGYHWFAYLPAVLWLLASVIATVLVWPSAREAGEGQDLAEFLVMLAVVFGLTRLWRILTLKCEYLKVAPAERVIHHIKGVINQTEMNPSRQGSIPGVERSLLGRIFGYSTLTLELQNGENLTMHCMKVTQAALDAWRGWKDR